MSIGPHIITCVIIKLIFDLFVIPGVDWNLTNNVFLIKNAIIVDFSSDHFVNFKKINVSSKSKHRKNTRNKKLARVVKKLNIYIHLHIFLFYRSYQQQHDD